MTQSLKFGVPLLAVLVSALMGIGIASGHDSFPTPTLMDTPVVSASLTEQDMQRIAARLNEIEPQ